MKATQTQALAGLALAAAIAGASPAAAQYGSTRATNRVPDPNAKRVMVTVFRSSDRGLGVQAADALRSRISSEFPFKQVYVLPREEQNAYLESSGFPTTEALAPHDARALATTLRADEYLTGVATRTPAGVKLDANLVLQRDQSLVQPLGSFEAGNPGGAASAISKELKEARKQLDGEQRCANAGREKKWDAAVAAAKEAIAAYPKAVLARICLATALQEQKASAADQMAVAKEIVQLHPTSSRGLALLAEAYRVANMPDSAVATLTALLATDPSNPTLQRQVVEVIAQTANPAAARPVVDKAVEANPGDPDLLKLRWLILMATRDYKTALTQGDELIRLDTSFADTTYFIRTSRALAADSQAQKAAEVAARGLQKFQNQPSLLYEQITSLRKAGQNQQALEALDRAKAANVAIENAATIRLLLLRDMNRTDEIVPAIRAAIAAGDTSSDLRTVLIATADAQRKAASASKDFAQFETARQTLLYADSVTTGQAKVQARFMLGAHYATFAQPKLAQAQEQKSCPLAKEAKNYLVEAQILLPQGGSFAPDAMRQLMGFVMQVDPSADALVKSLCK